MRAYTLISAPDTPACHKVRTYLRWRNVPFVEKPATSLVLRSEVRPRLRRIDVPLLIAADQRAWNDSRDMFDALDPSVPGTPLRPSDHASDVECMLVEDWLDQIIAPAASFRLWSAAPDATATRLALTAWPERSVSERERLSRMVGQRVFDRFRKLGFNADSLPELDNEIHGALARANRVLQETDYLFGSSPTIADAALFAVWLTLRETPGEPRLTERFDALSAWSERMSGPIGPHRVTTTRSERASRPRMDLVHQAATGFIPIALRASMAVSKWADDHPGQPVLPTCFRDAPTLDKDDEAPSRALRPADAWLLERLCNLIRTGEQPRTDPERDTLDRLNLTALRNFRPRRRVELRNFRFELDMTEKPSATVPDAVVRQVLQAMQRVGRDAADTGDVVNLVDP